MTDKELFEQALSWIEAQPVPRMLGGQRIIEAIRTRLAEPEEAPRPAVRLSDKQLIDIVDGLFYGGRWLDIARAIEAAVLKKNGLIE